MFAMRLTLLLLTTLAVGQCSQLRAAPYYMPLDNNPPDVEEVIKTTGVKDFILAFVLAPSSGGCVPTWDGNVKQKVSEDTKVLAKVKAIRALGGDVSVSFGGYTGVELGSSKACTDVKQLAEAYQSVIDKYELTHIDLDIEGDDLGDFPTEHNRFKAIKILKETAKSKGKQLFVTLTLPSTTVGLSDLGRDEIQKAIDDGVVIDLYKVMAFDYGGQGSDMANSVIKIMEMSHKQLKELRPELSEAQVYATTGLIIMNGHTDQASEMYSLQTFEKLVEYANDKGLGRMSFWALNRDRPCGNIKVGWVSGVCSSVVQNPYDFTKKLAKFGSTKPQTIPTPEPTPKPTPKPTPEPTRKPVSRPTLKTTPEPTRESTHRPVDHTSGTSDNETTATHPSTRRVTFSPIIDGVDCSKQADNVYFPYKNDCHEYIRCYQRLAHLEVCAKGTIYDTKLHLCNWPQNVDRPECK